MGLIAIRALRALLVVLAFGSLALQVLLVVQAATQPDSEPVFAVVAVVVIVCAQFGLGAIWVLLAMVRHDAIFDDERAFRWVGVIAVAGLVAAFLVGGLCAYAGEADDAPGLILIGVGVAVGGIAFALLMLVMRGLLHKATLLRRELDEVV